MSDKLTICAVVKARQNLIGDVVQLDLVDPSGGDLPKFEPGAHIDVHTKTGLIRQYSLCGDPDDRKIYRLGVLNEVESRGGSRSIFEDALIGTRLSISNPKQNFPMTKDARHTLLVGGGIGITPLISMAFALHKAQKDFFLHYCVMGSERAAFWDILLSCPFADKVKLHFSLEDGAPVFDIEKDIPKWQVKYHLYTCGPSGFMDWVLRGAEAKGFDKDHRHKEDFGADVDMSGASFVVEARQSGVTVEVEEGQSIAVALASCGVQVDVSCEEGVCGTCLTSVLEGEPDHRDEYLTEEEREAGDIILVCCSRSKTGRLVLDI